MSLPSTRLPLAAPPRLPRRGAVALALPSGRLVHAKVGLRAQAHSGEPRYLGHEQDPFAEDYGPIVHDLRLTLLRDEEPELADDPHEDLDTLIARTAGRVSEPEPASDEDDEDDGATWEDPGAIFDALAAAPLAPRGPAFHTDDAPSVHEDDPYTVATLVAGEFPVGWTDTPGGGSFGLLFDAAGSFPHVEQGMVLDALAEAGDLPSLSGSVFAVLSLRLHPAVPPEARVTTAAEMLRAAMRFWARGPRSLVLVSPDYLEDGRDAMLAAHAAANDAARAAGFTADELAAANPFALSADEWAAVADECRLTPYVDRLDAEDADTDTDTEGEAGASAQELHYWRVLRRPTRRESFD